MTDTPSPSSLDLANQRRLVVALAQSPELPGEPGQRQMIETHASFLLLAGDYAYKIKKPLNLGFLDYSTLAARRHCCEEEIRLNRRMAPSIYLDVQAIFGTPEAPHLTGAGAPLEYAVRMGRFPQEGLFDRMLGEGRLTPAHMGMVGRLLARFHREQAAVAGPQEEAFGTPAAVAYPVEENFAQLADLLGDSFDSQLGEVAAWSRAQLERLQPLFAQRRKQGWVRECHGDLHLGNLVAVAGQVMAFDGIEFNPNLRWIDVINEAAFLVMDLEHRGRPDLAWVFLNTYLSGTGDYAGLGLLKFYCLYRAMVRAKVALFLAGQQENGEAARQARAEADSYMAYARAALPSSSPTLVLTYGYSGSGKSVLAEGLAASLGAALIRSDVERKRLYGLEAKAVSHSGAGTGIYSREAGLRTYGRLLDLAGGILNHGYSCVVDATFLAPDQRAPFLALARERGIACRILECQAAPETLRQRVRQRQEQGEDASEATLEILESQLARGARWTPEEASLRLLVVTDQEETAASLQRLLTTLKGG
ncbi:bifunctional aminoglycoside phosphotransferase/ATP-binding protein [Azospira inquinata]|uniref:AAA family ATPase n=1 Tax=Azospira inquinata TaxID=2785627 RepID=A0A975SMA1_9RHOO|nr:bifunctional aminoglycoside phosphotransferase/ATP-binding protein [Azospira inquinata]QWT45737.1 AAA family ATPase [Azospira inquinata]QWT48940.1 AAA family ATPase [Azospira inquinata]